MTLSAPQSFLYKIITDIYRQVEEKNLFDYVEHHTPALMEALGIPMYFSKGSHTNIKITTKEDIDLFLGYQLAKQYKKEHIEECL
jgi:2-C-methyl-D-erythritol 4-phosphate cytidylyltransferase